MKIIVAHPGRQHSYRLASALKKNGMLAYYCTTIYDKESLSLMKLVKRFLSSDNLKRANSRKNPDLSDCDVIQFCELGGLLETLLVRIRYLKAIYDFIRKINIDRFGLKVAKLAHKNNVDAVVMYDGTSLKCFEYLSKKAPHIKRIMDISICARPYMKKIYDEEIEKTQKTDLKKDHHYMWNRSWLKRYEEEIKLTQYFLSASDFVKNSLLYLGVTEDQIKIVPYGANVDSDIVRHMKSTDSFVNFLFVGQVNYRKGVPTLLKAFSELDGARANLTLTGSYNRNDWFVKEYVGKDNIHFTGLVTRDKMKEIYEAADVFVIDSFAEGMAQVGIEAMACGLPVICSENSGVNDLVTNGENGFVIPCGDSDVLAEKMQWLLQNAEKISDMGQKARTTATAYTWTAYEENVVKALNEINLQ